MCVHWTASVLFAFLNQMQTEVKQDRPQLILVINLMHLVMCISCKVFWTSGGSCFTIPWQTQIISGQVALYQVGAAATTITTNSIHGC